VSVSEIFPSQELSEKLKSLLWSDAFLVQHTNKTNSGVIDIFKQIIYQQTELVPHQTLSYGISIRDVLGSTHVQPEVKVENGITALSKNRIGFQHFPFETLYTNTTFGLDCLSPTPVFKDLVDRSVAKEDIGSGDSIQSKLASEHNLDVRLNNENIYRSLFYPLKDKTIYFSDTEINTFIMQLELIQRSWHTMKLGPKEMRVKH